MLTRMRRLALVALMIACGRSNSAPVPAHGSDVVTKGNPPMTASPYQVRSDADLAVPLLTALGAAEKAKAGTFTVELAAGSYKHLQLESDELAIVALLSAQSSSSAAEGDPLVDLVARKKGATATLDRIWIVDSQAGTLIRLPANGPGRWSSVALSGLVLAGNRATRGFALAGLDPDGKGVAIDNAFVAEPALGEALFHLATARPVTVADSTLAVKDLAEGDYQPAVTTSEFSKPPAKLDAKAFLDAAKGGAIERAKLRGLLR